MRAKIEDFKTEISDRRVDHQMLLLMLLAVASPILAAIARAAS